MEGLGKGLASLGVGIAVSVAVWVTKDPSTLAGLLVIPLVYFYESK